MMIGMKPEDRERLNQQLIGPPRVNRPSLVDERAGFIPPAWWKGDEYASKSAMLARMTLKRSR
jgi:hypothetical protein